MTKKKVPFLGWIWIVILIGGITLVVMAVNFRFQEKFLREELISHTAVTTGTENVCICNICGMKGLAYCMHCGTPMKWDKASKHFVCPNCKNVGMPRCPNCNVLMFGETITPDNPNIITNGVPVPIY